MLSFMGKLAVKRKA